MALLPRRIGSLPEENQGFGEGRPFLGLNFAQRELWTGTGLRARNNGVLIGSTVGFGARCLLAALDLLLNPYGFTGSGTQPTLWLKSRSLRGG